MKDKVYIDALSKNFYLKIEKGDCVMLKKGSDKIYNLEDMDDKISVYEDRVKEWFLNIADRLKADNEAGFVILQIAVAYIEGNQQVREGSDSTGDSYYYFKEGMKRIFTKEKFDDEDIRIFYEKVRCGLFHDGITKSNVLLSGDFKKALEIKFPYKLIFINPHLFLDRIKRDFEDFLIHLKNPENTIAREKFDKIFVLQL